MRESLLLYLRAKRSILIVIALVTISIFLYYLNQPANIKLQLFSSTGKKQLFLVILDGTTQENKRISIANLSKELVVSGSRQEIALRSKPQYLQKVTLWIINPEYRYSRTEVKIPSRFSPTQTIKIAPPPWSVAIQYGVADYDEVIDHLNRIKNQYLTMLEPQERKQLVQSMDILNKIVAAADRDIQRHGTRNSDYMIKSKKLKTTFNELIGAINQ